MKFIQLVVIAVLLALIYTWAFIGFINKAALVEYGMSEVSVLAFSLLNLIITAIPGISIGKILLNEAFYIIFTIE